MSCEVLKLNSFEILGSTFAGRTFNFPDRDISQDKFTAKVRGFSLIEAINGMVVGKSVFFSKDSLSSLKCGRYVIEYWADFKGVAVEMIALEEFLISTTPCDFTNDSLVHNFILKFSTETIEYSVKSETTNVYIDFEDLTPEQIKELQKPALKVIEQTETALAKSVLATEYANNKADLANSAATSANTSAIQATNAANLANEKAELANNAAILAIANTNTAITNANTSATNADAKAALAQTAATNAATATSNATAKIAETETARQNAITATTNANNAAITANNAKGWSPVLVLDSTTIDRKSLLKLTDWTGGTGTKPTTNVGKWIKGDGTYTDVASEANNLKGDKGEVGPMAEVQYYDGGSANSVYSSETNIDGGNS